MMADDKETYTDETFTRVYNDQTGDYWQIGPDRDALGLCEIAFYAKGNPKPESSVIMPWAVAHIMQHSIQTLYNENLP